MEDLTLEINFTNGIITYNGIDYPFEQVEKIDDNCVHIFMGGQIIAFLGGQTSINGIAMANADDIINALNNN